MKRALPVVSLEEVKVESPRQPVETLWTCWWGGMWHGVWWEGAGWQQAKELPKVEEEEVEEEVDANFYDAPRDTWVTGADLTKAKAQFLNFQAEQAVDLVLETDVSLDNTEVGELYEVVGNIAKIGTSILKRARERPSNQPVTLKVSGAVLDDMYSVQQYEHEEKFFSAQAKVEGVPSFLRSHKSDIFVSAFRPVDGTDLLSWLQDKSASKGFDLAQVRKLFRQMVSLAHSLHSVSLLHRGLVPSNFFISDERVFLFDARFWLSLPPSGKTQDPWSINPYFQPPEIILRQSYGVKAEMWGLGIVLSVCLTGTTPFFDKNSLRHSKSVREGKLDAFLPLLPGDARDLLQRLLTLSPDDRISAADALSHPFFASNESSPLSIHENLKKTIDFLF